MVCDRDRSSKEYLGGKEREPEQGSCEVENTKLADTSGEQGQRNCEARNANLLETDKRLDAHCSTDRIADRNTDHNTDHNTDRNTDRNTDCDTNHNTDCNTTAQRRRISKETLQARRHDDEEGDK